MMADEHESLLDDVADILITMFFFFFFSVAFPCDQTEDNFSYTVDCKQKQSQFFYIGRNHHEKKLNPHHLYP